MRRHDAKSDKAQQYTQSDDRLVAHDTLLALFVVASCPSDAQRSSPSISQSQRGDREVRVIASRTQTESNRFTAGRCKVEGFAYVVHCQAFAPQHEVRRDRAWVGLIENRVRCGSHATALTALARRSCTAMIACRISQIGTSTVGTNDQGACCIAFEPGLGKSCKGEPSADVTPKAIASTRSAAPNRFHAPIAAARRAPPSFRSHSPGTAATPVMMSPQAALYGNGPVSRPSAASIRNSTAKMRTILSATITGNGMLSIALRAAGHAVANATARSGTATKSPTTRTSREVRT